MESEENGIERVKENKFFDFILEEELKTLFMEYTTKFLEGRNYVENKINDWANAIMDEFEMFCKKRNYIFFLSLRIYPNKIKYIPNRCDSYDFSDCRTFVFERGFPYFYVVMRVYYIKKMKNQKFMKNLKFIQNDSQNIIYKKIKKIVSNIIDERKYLNDDVKKYTDYIRNDIRNFLNSNFSHCKYIFFWTLSEKSKKLTLSYRAINLISNEYCSGLNFTSEIECNIHWLIF